MRIEQHADGSVAIVIRYIVVSPLRRTEEMCDTEITSAKLILKCSLLDGSSENESMKFINMFEDVIKHIEQQIQNWFELYTKTAYELDSMKTYFLCTQMQTARNILYQQVCLSHSHSVSRSPTHSYLNNFVINL